MSLQSIVNIESLIKQKAASEKLAAFSILSTIKLWITFDFWVLKSKSYPHIHKKPVDNFQKIDFHLDFSKSYPQANSDFWAENRQKPAKNAQKRVIHSQIVDNSTKISISQIQKIIFSKLSTGLSTGLWITF